ncbi:MAG: hypothetical protein LBE91_13410, partial [Tannerella sp.]|nr:hypothetical protein [Tannerella sp.]
MNTRYLKFIPVTAMLLSGIFPVRAQMQPTPGGATNTAFSAWLTPGSYDAGTWTNLISGGIGNFTGMQTAPAKINTNGYNFHPAVLFGKTTASAAPNQLYSQLPIGIKPSDDITAIFVFRQNVTNADAYLMSFSDNSAYNALWWNSVSNKNLSYNWSGSTRTVNNASEGILTVDNSNISATLAQEGIRVFQNGSKTAFASNQWNGTSNLGTGKVALGGGRNDREYYGYQGNLQEVILIKNPNNGHVNDADLRKIHSYLAIKYGITLNNADHYINSDGTAVWTRDAVYNTNIFGIGRDDASRLNQVQSRSAGNDLLTVFKGTLNVLNNNNSTALADKTCLMLGSSGQTGYVPYEYQAGEPFANGNLGEKVNYRTAAVYKAQVTSGGIAGGNQTVNMQVTYPLVRFVLVSANPAFLPGSTRIYPVTGQMATNIVINSGDYVSFSTYQLLPGNATNTGFAAWLTPDSYRSTGTWTNLIVKPGTVGDFSGAQTPPATGVSGGYNFHPVVTFNKTSNSSAPNQLFSQQQFPINTTDNVTSIFVFQRKTINNYDFLIGFSGSDNYNSLSWRNTGNNNLTFRWGGTPDRLILNAAEGILTVDNSNAVQTLAQEGIRVYQNGVKTPFASNQWNGTTNAGFRLVALGGAQNDETAYGYQGNLQEVILIKNPGNGHVDAVDLQKIHSYLAVKYGITLNNSDHYLNSDGNVVWTRDAVYNYCIFGIGRDNDSRLYQKQSQSVDNKRFTLFIGSKKETLNSLNDGILQ